MKKKTWLLVAGVIIGAPLIFAVISLFIIHSGVGIMDVKDFKAQPSSLPGQQTSLRGRVSPGSVNLDEKTQVVTFVLTDDRETLNVTYQGKLPNNFKPGAVLEVLGVYRSDGVFEANGFGRPSMFCVICHG